MHRVIITLVCLVCASCGRRVQTTQSLSSREQSDSHLAFQSESNKHLDVPRSSRALAKLLLILDPSTAWQVISARRDSGIARISTGILARARQAFLMTLVEAPLELPARRDVVLPRVQYLVPSQAIGWKGRPEYGENSSLWYDSEGLRNGPPANFWRQNADENGYRKSMEAVAAVLGEADESVLNELESRMSIRYPLLNRKLFGEWLPLVARGRRIGLMLDGDSGVAVPATISLKRPGERKAIETNYLTQDLHMEDGEQLSVILRSLVDSAIPQYEATFSATSSKEKQVMTFGKVDKRFDWILDSDGIMNFGNVSLLNEYLLVQRARSGEITDLYMRCDPKGSADQLLVSETLSTTKLQGIDGALDRSRLERVEFRKHFFEAIFGLKADVPNAVTREPNWNYMAEDFALVDRNGVSLKGLDHFKFLLKRLREFRSNLATTTLQADFKVLSLVKIPRPPIKASWSLEIRGPDDLDSSAASELKQKHLPYLPASYGLPLSILGNCTFSFNTEGKIGAMLLDSFTVNGHELNFPEVPKGSEMDEAQVEDFAREIFSSLSD